MGDLSHGGNNVPQALSLLALVFYPFFLAFLPIILRKVAFRVRWLYRINLQESSPGVMDVNTLTYGSALEIEPTDILKL